MKLVMFLGYDCIEAVNIEEASVVLPGYISHFVKELRRKYGELISQSACEPEFLIQREARKPQMTFTTPFFMEMPLEDLKVAG